MLSFLEEAMFEIMTDQFVDANKMVSITPPPELVQQWLTEGRHQDYCGATEHAIAQAARWGADQELEACCEWLVGDRLSVTASRLRTVRRPQPPSLKEQALKALTKIEDNEATYLDSSVIRRALEALDG